MNPLSLFSHICQYLKIKCPKVLLKDNLADDLAIVFLSQTGKVLINRNFTLNYQTILQFSVCGYFCYQQSNGQTLNLNEAIEFAKKYFDRFYQTELIIETGDRETLAKIYK
ncbi:MAG: hypothetical protein ACI4WG_04545 [Erysipelotrichaceae bacterium]